MGKYNILYIQASIVILCFPIFAFFGKLKDPLNAYIFSFLAYWILISFASISFILLDSRKTAKLSNYLIKAKRKYLLGLSFVPTMGVLFIVFLPNLPSLNPWLLSAVLLISLFNGVLEELFWRGITLVEYAESVPLLFISTALFTTFHFAFLLLPLEYQGGAVNLVAGSAIMGALWLFVAKYTENITAIMVAHVLVNLFAFVGLFIDNNLGPN